MSWQPDLPALYGVMCRIRAVERVSAGLWADGRIPGELHSGVGEEAVAAGVVAHVEEGDAIAVDHRSTPPMVARGIDVEALLCELLGADAGVDGGRAGHMHVMSPAHLAAASGIVGSAAPLACGFGLAAQQGGQQRVAVAFFGDGAVNEGMLTEAVNLAVAWHLPVVFVCKDNRWAITTRSRSVTGGSLRRRFRAFGLPVWSVDGTDVAAVWRAADRAFRRARVGSGPSVLLARVPRPDGHFLGDRLVALAVHPSRQAAELRRLQEPLRKQPGAPWSQRLRALAGMTATIAAATADRAWTDPLERARKRVPADVAAGIELTVEAEVAAAENAARELAIGHA